MNPTEEDDQALARMDDLMACWNYWDQHETYYLEVLAPAIVSGEGHGLSKPEEQLVVELRSLLDDDEWEQLPDLMRRRQAGELDELSSDAERRRLRREREQAEAERRAEEERQRLAQEAEADRAAAARRAVEAELQAAREHKRVALLARIRSLLESDFLSARTSVMPELEPGVVTVEEFDQMRVDFVRDWALRELDVTLDAEQAAAVAAVDGHVQVIARAGSGKTRTLVTRALFLQRHCRVDPSELLLLAFNRKAAEEMTTRLEAALDERLPHAMTFHALAYALVHPGEALVFDNREADQLGLSREVQEVIDEHVRGATWGPRIRELMLAHFREDWEAIVRAGLHLSMDEFLAQRRGLVSESLGGEFVKSFGERLIANALFENDVEYAYERNFRWNGENYRPDFTISTGKNSGVVIEYFGLKGEPDYDEQSERKRAFWSERPGWTLIEMSPHDIGRLGAEEAVTRLLSKLTRLGLRPHRLSEEEIWNKVKERAIDRFTGAMTSFIGRCRKANLDPEGLRGLIDTHRSSSPAESLFLQVGVSIFEGYLDRLSETGSEDFDGLMWRAIDTVRSGTSRFSRDGGRERGDLHRLRFIMIDEFQDFSKMFLELTQATLMASTDAHVFCVGDDWQAINGFAGSDTAYFNNFSTYFEDSDTKYLLTNYRSGSSIVEAGNALMRGLGAGGLPWRPVDGDVRIGSLDAFEPSPGEQAIHDGDEITPAVMRLIGEMLSRDLDVVLLTRRNRLPWFVRYPSDQRRSHGLNGFLDYVRSFLPEDDKHRVEISTAHKYKGLEKPGVIVLDALLGSFPLIHPSWIFLQVFGDTLDSLEAEERHLFYVAATRAEDSLVLLTEAPRESPYLEPLRAQASELDWRSLPPAAALDGARVEVRVRDAHQVKDVLKERGYRFSASGRYWYKSVLAEVFTIEALERQAWTRSGCRIEVIGEGGGVLHEMRPGAEPAQETGRRT